MTTTERVLIRCIRRMEAARGTGMEEEATRLYELMLRRVWGAS